MPDYDDAALEQILRRTLVERLGSMPLDLTVEGVEARARTATRKRSDRRRLLVLGLAAALIVPIGWLAVGAPTPRFPTAGTYQALVSRWEINVAGQGRVDALEVIAIRSDGQERLVRRLRQDDMPQGFQLGIGGLASPNGWLAVSGNEWTKWALMDLQDETAPISTIDVDTGNVPIGWGPDGRFAWIDTRGLNVIDPRTGVTQTDASGWSVDQSEVFWTTDATGFVVASGTPLRSYLGQPGLLRWQNRPIGSSQSNQPFIPAYEPLGGRTYSLAGDRFVVCSGPVHGMGMCPGDGRGLVVRQDLPGAITEWEVTAEAGAPVSAGFAATDRGMWLVSQDYPGEADASVDASMDGRVILQRLDDQGGVRQTLGAALGTGFTSPSLEGMAPDDSLARIMTSPEDPDALSWILVPTDGSPPTYHVGAFIGYVSASVADRLPGATFQPTVGVEAPVVGRAVDLPSAEALERYAASSIGITTGDRVVLRAASTDPGTGNLAVSIPPGHRIGFQVACSGRGTVEVTIADQGFGAECMADDQSAYGYTVDMADGANLAIQVGADPGTSWRIVVFDIRVPGAS